MTPLSEAAAQIDRQESERERQVTLNEELAAIPADDDGPSAAGVTAALTALAGIPALIDEANETDGQSREWRSRGESASRGRESRERGASSARTTVIQAGAGTGTGPGTAGRTATTRAGGGALRGGAGSYSQQSTQDELSRSERLQYAARQRLRRRTPK